MHINIKNIAKFKLRNKPKLTASGKIFRIETSPAVEVPFSTGRKEHVDVIIIENNKIETDGLGLEKGRYVTFAESIISADRCKIDNGALVINAKNLKIEAKVEKGELEEILEGINDNFDLTTAPSARAFICPKNGYSHQKTYLSATELETITNTICQYIKNHQDQFILSENTIDAKLTRGFPRPWYSPENYEPDRLSSIAWETSQGTEGQGMAGSMRQIEVTNEYEAGYRKILHPIFFSQEQFEKIKNSLADNVSCKVSGCYNNFCGYDSNATDEQNEILLNHIECTKVRNGKCLYHQIKEKIHEEGGQRNTGNQTNTNSLTLEDIKHNRKADEYWKKLSPDIEDNNFRETKDNFLADASGGKFDEVDRDLTNEIRNKLREEESGTGAFLDDNLIPISKIEVGDDAAIKNEKKLVLTNLGSFNEAIVEGRKEIIRLIKDLQRKQDEYTNQNNNNDETTDNNNNQSLSELRKKIISLINNALHNQEPKISSEELEPDNRNWEQIINKESISKEEMNNLKERVLFDISGKREAKFSADRLKNLVAEAKNLNNYEELAKKLSQIEKYRGQGGYNSLQSEINDLEMKLAQLKPENYRKDSAEAVNQKLAQTGMKKSDLSSETKKELEGVEKGEITDPKKIKEIKDKSMNEIAQKCADSELDKLIKEYNSASTPQAKNAVKRKLYSFISSSNSFHKQSYQKQKDKVNKILGNESNSREEKNLSNLFIPVIIISGSLAFLVGSWLLIRHRRLKKKSL